MKTLGALLLSTYALASPLAGIHAYLVPDLTFGPWGGIGVIPGLLLGSDHAHLVLWPAPGPAHPITGWPMSYTWNATLKLLWPIPIAPSFALTPGITTTASLVLREEGATATVSLTAGFTLMAHGDLARLRLGLGTELVRGYGFAPVVYFVWRW